MTINLWVIISILFINIMLFDSARRILSSRYCCLIFFMGCLTANAQTDAAIDSICDALERELALDEVTVTAQRKNTRVIRGGIL